MAKELWDAYDREGRPLGFDVVRGEPLPEGVCHLVVEIYSVTHDGRVLVTQRHPDKHWGLNWEITGGGAVKGETPVTGALRELREETGIVVTEADLHPVYVHFPTGIDGDDSIYHSFLVFFAPEQQTIALREGETVDWRLIPYEEYKEFILTDEFVDRVRNRFLAHQEQFDRMIGEHIHVK